MQKEIHRNAASTLILESALVSEDWQLAEDGSKPASLIVQLRRRVHTLPWFRFVYADGDESSVKLAFASHMVTVTGHGLAALLAAVAGQRVLRLIQPTENEAKFRVRGSRRFSSLPLTCSRSWIICWQTNRVRGLIHSRDS